MTLRRPRRSPLARAASRRGIAAAIGVAAMLVAVTGAFAFWSGSGSGPTQVRLADVQSLALAPGAVSATLVPGGTSDIAVVASNPNPFPVKIDELARNSAQGTAGFDVDSAHSGCDPASLSFSLSTNGNAGWSVPPKTGSTDGSLLITLTGALGMSSSAASACQGATFTVYLRAVDLGASS